MSDMQRSGWALPGENTILRGVARHVLPQGLAAPGRLLERCRLQLHVFWFDLELLFHVLGTFGGAHPALGFRRQDLWSSTGSRLLRRQVELRALRDPLAKKK